MDFRRADPTYVNFVPQTCVDAIDLFNRHRTLGLTQALYPECFIHCARRLPPDELDKFHRFIINPDGDITKGGEKPTMVDQQLEDERRQLEKECDLREMESLSIKEDYLESPTDPMSEEKTEEYVKISI